MGADLSPASLEVNVDLGALVVRDGTGGIKPLTDRDKREIAVTRAQGTVRGPLPGGHVHAPRASSPSGNGGVIAGTLTLAGQSRPERLAG